MGAWKLYRREHLLRMSGDEYAAFVAAKGQWLRPRHVRALELAAIRSGMQVLDLGCGRGEVALHVARRGATVVAADFSPAAMELTAETLSLGPENAQRRGHLCRTDAVALPFPNATFDRVLFLDVAEHLPPAALEQALGEIRRVLRPDGYAVIHTLPNRWALAFGYPLLRLLWPKLPRVPRSAYERQVHVNELTPVGLHHALRRAGLEGRVWLENWTTVHAAWSQGRRFADPVRDGAYPHLRAPWVHLIAVGLAHTPLRLVFANDLFAIAWPYGMSPPPRRWPRAWTERGVVALTHLMRDGGV